MTKAKRARIAQTLENPENRKREFVNRLKRNLAIVDPKLRDRLANEFKTLTIGR